MFRQFDYINRVFYVMIDDGGDGDGPAIIDPDVTPELPDNDIIPKTRFERFLAKIAGADDDIIPKTRTEYYLNMIADTINDCGGDEEGEIKKPFLPTPPTPGPSIPSN